MGDRLTRARTVTLLGSVLTSLSSGTNYVFSAYAPQLASRLHITYTQLNVIGLSGNMGVYTTGIVFGRVVDKRGPRLLLVVSSIFLFVGYMGLRSYYDAGPSSKGDLPVLSLIAMSVLSYVTGAGGCSGLTAAVNSTAKSFPEHLRATTVGFVLSGFGLSAFFFSALARWLFPGNTSSLLLFLSLGTSIPVIIGFLTVRPVPHSERPDPGPGGVAWHSEGDERGGSTSRLLDHSSSRTTANERNLAGFVGGASMGDEDTNATERSLSEVYPEVLSGVKVAQSRSHSIELSPSRGDRARSSSSSRKPVSRTRSVLPPEPVDVHGIRMLIGWEFWLLFTILSLLSGTGLMFINNVGTVAQALLAKGNPDYDRVLAASLQAFQVSIISLANCGARVGFGAGADYLKIRFAIHRSYLLSAVSALLVVSQIAGARIENVNHLWLASILLGLGYGGIFGLLPTVTIDWFGLAHFSENWGYVCLAPLLGGNIFSILFGRNLDAHIPKTADFEAAEASSFPSSPSSSPSSSSSSPSSSSFTNPPHLSPSTPDRQCLDGRACYTSTLAVTTLACVLALLLSFIAAWRDRRRAVMTRKYESLSQEADDVLWENEGDE